MSEIDIHDGQAEAILRLRGAIDASHNAELLAAAVAVSGLGKPVVLEWSQAEHLHAGAFQVLLALNAELAAQGHRLHVSACSPAVRNCILSAGLARTFPSQLVPKENAF